jgi:hypothetical protein
MIWFDDMILALMALRSWVYLKREEALAMLLFDMP